MIFLERVAEQLDTSYFPDFSEYLIIFPNRRSIVFFKDLLKKKWPSRSFIYPEVVDLNQWIYRQQNLMPADSVELEVRLFQVIQSFSLPDRLKEISSFLSWSGKLLNDFNDIDLQLCRVEEVFPAYRAYRAIDLRFSTNEENFEKAYLDLIDKVPEIYSVFTKNLLCDGVAYQGLAFREFFHSLQKEENQELKKKKIILAGFNALSRSETEIFKILENRYAAVLLWDADAYYFKKDPPHEAGLFLQRNELCFRSKPSDHLTHYFSGKKKIHLCPASGKMEQLIVLQQQMKKAALSDQNTVIVFAEEDLILPFLAFLPEGSQPVNITLGMNLSYGLFFHFILQCVRIYKEKVFRASQIYYPSLQSFMASMVWRFINPSLDRTIQQHLRKNNTFFIETATLMQHLALHSISFLAKAEGQSLSLANHLYQLTKELREKVHISGGYSEDEYKMIDNELNILAHTLNRLVYFEEVLKEALDPAAVEKYLLHYMRTEYLPFIGEPLSGLQVMGLLETRNLNFDNVHVVGCNEDYLPGSDHLNTLLISEIRKKYGLPSVKERQAVVAYHFYRLIQYARQVFLYYVENIEGIHSSEPSRYLHQIEYEWQHYHEIETSRYSFLPLRKAKQKEVRASAYSINKAMQLLSKGVSPTALFTFIRCPLDFYYKYLVNIREKEDITEELTPNELGDLIHRALKELYEPYVGKYLSAEALSSILEENYIGKVVNHVFEQQKCEVHHKGINAVMKELSKRQIQKIVERDSRKMGGEVKLIGVEHVVTDYMKVDEVSVTLKGVADRIQQANNQHIVIDYKTGARKNVRHSLTDDSYYFQMMFYLWLYGRVNKICITSPDTLLKAEIWWIQNPDVEKTEVLIPEQPRMEELEALIAESVRSWLSPEYVFVHNNRSNYCSFCNFL